MIEQTIREIRTKCRLKMNGVASTSMREKGLNYKLNFGLMIPQIKLLAAEYQQSKELAEMLWKEDTRELKILATLLYPVAKLSEDSAKQWALDISNHELREQLCMNLLQEVAFAKELAIELSISDNRTIRTTGYWLITRLFLSKKIDASPKLEKLIYIWEDSICDDLFARNASLSTLKQLGRQSGEMAKQILKRIAHYKSDSHPIKQEVYNSLSFEFEFI